MTGSREIRFVLAVVTLLGTGWLTAVAPAGAEKKGDCGTITEYRVPSAGILPGIAVGPDGNLWFPIHRPGGPRGEEADAIFGRLDPRAGTITEFVVPVHHAIHDLVAGPGGDLWFTEMVANRIGRMTTEGAVVAEYPLPTGSPGWQTTSSPWGITVGPDGAIWFTEKSGNKIGRLDPDSGAITEFSLPGGGSGGPRGRPAFHSPAGITAGPDGALWFTMTGGIGRSTTAGDITVFPVEGLSEAAGITVGRDGALWFIKDGAIGRITTEGALSEFPAMTGGYTTNITVDKYGAIWFTSQSEQVGRLDPRTGVVLYFSLPNAHAQDIVAGPDGDVWFSERRGGNIGEVETKGCTRLVMEAKRAPTTTTTTVPYQPPPRDEPIEIIIVE